MDHIKAVRKHGEGQGRIAQGSKGRIAQGSKAKGGAATGGAPTAKGRHGHRTGQGPRAVRPT